MCPRQHLYPRSSLTVRQDVKTLKLTPNTSRTPPSADSVTDVASFVCPMNLKEMNGTQPFVYIWTCGCVFSQAGLRAVSSTPKEDSTPKSGSDEDKDSAKPTEKPKQLDVCPQCATKYDRAHDVLLLNPPSEEEEKMYVAMLERRKAEPTKKSKKRKAATPPEQAGEQPPAKAKKTASAPSINQNMGSASRKVASEMAEEEAKRRAGMSDAVKSLYLQKGAPARKETFMTMGTFTRVSTSLCTHGDDY